jgi:hypothetical protein
MHSLKGKKDVSSSSRSQGKKNDGSTSSVRSSLVRSSVRTSVEEVHFSDV